MPIKTSLGAVLAEWSQLDPALGSRTAAEVKTLLTQFVEKHFDEPGRYVHPACMSCSLCMAPCMHGNPLSEPPVGSM